MPQQQIELGSVPAGQGDFIHRMNQVAFVRTTNATPTVQAIFPTSSSDVRSASVTVGAIVTAHLLDATLTDTLTTLTNNMGAFDTTLDYIGADPPFAIGDVLAIDGEWMGVGFVDSATNHLEALERPATPAEHTAGATIYRVGATGATPITAHWGRQVSFRIEPLVVGSATMTGVVRDLFPASKDPGALALDCQMSCTTPHTDFTEVSVTVTGIAATTIDWTIHSSASIYYHIV